MLKGYKTYVMAFAMICWAAGGLIAGKVEFQLAVQTVLIALGMMGLRKALP